MKSPSWSLILFFTCVSFLSGGCSREELYEKPLTPVRVHPVMTQRADGSVRYSASITPYAQVELTFKVNGYIQEILQLPGADGHQRDVQAGDIVKKGTVIARVREAEYVEKVKEAEAQLAKAQASLKKSAADFERSSTLFATKSVTAPDYDRVRSQFEEAQATVDGARAQLETAKLNLQYCALTTPMNGVVLQRNIEVGSFVGPGTAGFVFADVSRVKAVFGVPEGMLTTLELGAPLAITVASIRGREFPGQITLISPAADQKSRVFNVGITAPNPQGELKVGMIASLKVAEGERPEAVTVVPLSAVVRAADDPAGYAVFVVEESNGKTVSRIRTVQLGLVYGDKIAATNGLQTGEKVIVTGATLVKDGEPVRIIP